VGRRFDSCRAHHHHSVSLFPFPQPVRCWCRLTPLQKTDNHNLLTVLLLSFVLGMAVALAVYFAWRLNMGDLQGRGFLTAVALSVCPPFVLSLVIGPTPDSNLAFVLVVGTIVFANAFLYAGVAAGGYFIFTLMARRKARR
jgi:hypothetical protein